MEKYNQSKQEKLLNLTMAKTDLNDLTKLKLHKKLLISKKSLSISFARISHLYKELDNYAEQPI